jgi:3-oxoadipate enol-lactonase
MPYAEAGIRLWYDRRGQGEPLLWLTGFGISAAILEPVLDDYADHAECVVFDPRGAGRSAAPLRPVTMAQFAADAVALLDVLGIPSAHVYGLSWGGIVGQELAIRFPARVHSLILGGAPVVGLRAPVPGPRRLAAIGMLGAGNLLGWTVRDTRLLEPLLFSSDFRRDHREEARELLLLLTAHRPAPHGLVWQQLATILDDTASRLGQITVPTLVVRGERDALLPRRHAQMLAERIPAADLVEVPGSGHLYVFERRAESLALVTEWLARHHSGARR